MKWMTKGVVLAAAGCLTWAGAANVLDFEGIADYGSVGEYYNGDGGPAWGISFSPNGLALVDSDAGGSGNFANEPSPDTILIFTAGESTVMNVPAGFDTGFSFFYSANTSPGSIDVFEGVNATGALLAHIDLDPLGGGVGDPNGGANGNWAPVGVAFDGTARSVSFAGSANLIGFDNITIGSASPGGGEAPDINVTDSVDPNNDLYVPFGIVEIGSESAAETVTVTNSGSAVLTIAAVELEAVMDSESDMSLPTECKALVVSEACRKQIDVQVEKLEAPASSDFHILVDNCTETTLEPAASCTIKVQFAPQGACKRTQTLRITSNDPDEGVVPVLLEGVAKGGSFSTDIRVSPYFDIYFPFVPLERESAPRMVTLFNASRTPKQVDDISLIDGDADRFALVPDAFEGVFRTPCEEPPFTLQPYESCVFGTTFTPEAVGMARTTLGVFSDDECSLRNVFGQGWDYGAFRYPKK